MVAAAASPNALPRRIDGDVRLARRKPAGGEPLGDRSPVAMRDRGERASAIGLGDRIPLMYRSPRSSSLNIWGSRCHALAIRFDANATPREMTALLARLVVEAALVAEPRRSRLPLAGAVRGRAASPLPAPSPASALAAALAGMRRDSAREIGTAVSGGRGEVRGGPCMESARPSSPPECANAASVRSRRKRVERRTDGEREWGPTRFSVTASCGASPIVWPLLEPTKVGAVSDPCEPLPPPDPANGGCGGDPPTWHRLHIGQL